jgi:hypothetical protein
MRKVLLATTALVAISGITAANADISISGNYEWEYTNKDTGSTFGSDSHITIKGTNAADNGMTFTAVTVLGNGDLDSNHIKVDGDFGTVYLGDVDGNSASSLMDGALGRNKGWLLWVRLYPKWPTTLGGNDLSYGGLLQSDQPKLLLMNRETDSQLNRWGNLNDEKLYRAGLAGYYIGTTSTWFITCQCFCTRCR